MNREYNFILLQSSYYDDFRFAISFIVTAIKFNKYLAVILDFNLEVPVSVDRSNNLAGLVLSITIMYKRFNFVAMDYYYYHYYYYGGCPTFY